MGYFDGFTANLFRTTSDGRRVYAPFGRYGSVYLVPDDAAPPITTAFRRFYQVMLVAIIGTQIFAGWRWNLFLVAPLFILSGVLLAWYLTRHLPVAPEGASALPKLSRRDLLQRQGTAMGKPVTYGLLVVSLLFTAGGVWMVATGVPIGWFVAAFFGLCTVSFVVQLGRKR